jgi:HAD superfamily hydrolase (TIGR01509 family)
VIADTEAVHLAAYNATFAAHARDIGGELAIAPATYYARYMVYGDREAIWHMLRDHGRSTDEGLVAKLMEAKGHFVEQKLNDFAEPLPGVRDLLTWLEANNVPRAICSGARRGEIEELLEAFKLRHHFDVLVTIEDVRLGKPDPQGYNLCFDKLNLEYDAELEKDYSLVIEDSAGGCSAAQAAGLRVLGVATSLPVKELHKCATYVVESLAELDKDTLATWLGIED